MKEIDLGSLNSRQKHASASVCVLQDSAKRVHLWWTLSCKFSVWLQTVVTLLTFKGQCWPLREWRGADKALLLHESKNTEASLQGALENTESSLCSSKLTMVVRLNGSSYVSLSSSWLNIAHLRLVFKKSYVVVSSIFLFFPWALAHCRVNIAARQTGCELRCVCSDGSTARTEHCTCWESCGFFLCLFKLWLNLLKSQRFRLLLTTSVAELDTDRKLQEHAWHLNITWQTVKSLEESLC